MLGIEIGEANTPSGTRLDAYVSGADLVAIYEESPPAQLRTQCYWRIIEPSLFAPQNASEVVFALDLILSVNTSLLENNPQSQVLSHIMQTQERFELICDERQQLRFHAVRDSSKHTTERSTGTGCFLSRFGPTDFSFVQMVHPVDFNGAMRRRRNHLPSVVSATVGKGSHSTIPRACGCATSRLRFADGIGRL